MTPRSGPVPVGGGGGAVGGTRHVGRQARPGAAVLRPSGVHDLRGRPEPRVLAYPPQDVLVVSGLPGSGKTTFLARTTGGATGGPAGGAAPRTADADTVRLRAAARLPAGLPYPLYRLPVRVLHYARLARHALAGGPLLVHDCGTSPLVRRALVRAVRRRGGRVHLLVLDVPPSRALAGQRQRGRTVPDAAFARHRAGAARLVAVLAAAAPAGRPPDGCASAVLLDRATADAVRRVVFAPQGGGAV